MHILLKVVVFSSTFLLWSCSTTSEPQLPENATECSAPRPQMCTMQYDPVCATDKEGKTKTYSTDCTACSNPEVIFHQPKACEE